MSIEKIEPEATAIIENSSKSEAYDVSVALTSIAVSMKRIADAVEYHPAGNENLFDLIRSIANSHSR